MKLFIIILSWILVIIWMIFIFMMSSMNSKSSSKVSNGLLKKTVTTTYEITSKVGITDMPSNERINDTVSTLHFPVRKVAHFLEYLVLALLLFNALMVTGVKKNLFIIILIICFIYACSDEIHQLFIKGRACRIYDIVIDTFGSLLGIIIIRKNYKK